jgi:hypothetical protein
MRSKVKVPPGFSIQSYYFIFHFANTDSPNFTIQSYYFIFQLCKGTFCQYRFSQFYYSITLFYISVMQTDILPIPLLAVLQFNHTILYFSYADGHFANTVTPGFTIQSVKMFKHHVLCLLLFINTLFFSYL